MSLPFRLAPPHLGDTFVPLPRRRIEARFIPVAPPTGDVAWPVTPQTPSHKTWSMTSDDKNLAWYTRL
jgi:hypothetical protein